MENNKKITVIIPAWFTKNQHGRFGKHETFAIASECLNRFIQVIPKEICNLILINNGSDLEDDDMKNEEHIRFTPSWYWSQADIVIHNKVNVGFAPAINLGIALANTEYVMQLNNDILVWPGFLEQMIADFEEAEKLNPPVGLLMPAIVKEKIGFWDILKKKKEEIDMTTNAGRFGIKAEFGSCYLGKRELFKKISEFRDGYQVLDENFKIGFGEDRWLYREVRMLKKETYRTHNLRVYHVGNLSMGKIKKQEGVREAIDKNREYLKELKIKNNID